MDGGVLLFTLLIGGAILYVQGTTLAALSRLALCAVCAVAVGVSGNWLEAAIQRASGDEALAGDLHFLFGTTAPMVMAVGLIPLRGLWLRVVAAAIGLNVSVALVSQREALAGLVTSDSVLKSRLATLILAGFLTASAATLFLCARVAACRLLTPLSARWPGTYRQTVGVSLAMLAAGCVYLAVGSPVLSSAVFVYVSLPVFADFHKRAVLAAALNVVVGCAVYLALRPLPTEGPRLIALIGVWCVTYGATQGRNWSPRPSSEGSRQEQPSG